MASNEVMEPSRAAAGAAATRHSAAAASAALTVGRTDTRVRYPAAAGAETQNSANGSDARGAYRPAGSETTWPCSARITASTVATLANVSWAIRAGSSPSAASSAICACWRAVGEDPAE